MHLHRPSLWKLFFAKPAGAFVSLIVAFLGLLVYFVDIRPDPAWFATAWLDPDFGWSTKFEFTFALGLAAVGIGIAYTFVKFGIRHLSLHRHRPEAFYELCLRAAAYTSTTWKSLLKLGHATGIMLGAALSVTFGHRRPVPMLS